MNCPAVLPLTDNPSVEPAVLDFFRTHPHPSLMHRPIPAPEPDPEPNPSPDAIAFSGCSCINSKDWDVMFLAIQMRLEDCGKDAGGSLSDSELRKRCAVTETVVLECIEAMKQLHSALTTERAGHDIGQPAMQLPV